MTTMIRTESHLGAYRTDTSMVCNCGAVFPATIHPTEDDRYESPGWATHARRHGNVHAWWDGEPGDSTVMLQVVGVTHVTEQEARRQVEERLGSEEIDAAVAVTIASWWQSAGTTGRSMAALASGAPVDAGDLLVEVSVNRRLYTQEHSAEEAALDMLGTWIVRATSNP